MKLIMVIAFWGALSQTELALADPYQDAINGLLGASYKHLELTYACRNVTGLSHYRNAYAAAENAVRATGMPTDAAMSAVAEMTSRIEAAPSTKPGLLLNECTAGIARTKEELLQWWGKFRLSQQ